MTSRLSYDGRIPIMGGHVTCPSCREEFEVYTPKNQGVKDWYKLRNSRASERHKMIISAFLRDSSESLTVNDIVLNIKRNIYEETGKATDIDKADISRERAELFSWKIIGMTGERYANAPKYVIADMKKALDLLGGGTFGG